jgi:hypothetical protein
MREQETWAEDKLKADLFDTLTAHIRIGSVDYQIKRTVGLVDGDDKKMAGRIRYDSAIIEIEQRLAPVIALQVLWHEVLHALLTQSGHYDQDEPLLDAIAYGLVGILRDNPWLLDAVDIL